MIWISLGLIVLLTLFDQLSKWGVKLNPIFNGPNVSIVPNVLEFKYVENTGSAYGMLEGQMWFFYIITIIALIGLGFLFSKIKNSRKVYAISIALLMAGALGNAIDRVNINYVIDFIHFPFVAGIHPIFDFYCNLADVYLTFGIILFITDFIILDHFRKKQKDKEYEKKEVSEREQNENNNNREY